MPFIREEKQIALMKLWMKIRNRLRRDASRFLGTRVIHISPDQPIVSFTFDDFPRSALWNGGSILRTSGWHGTYYASFGLMGKTAPTGDIFTEDDLTEFSRQQHELGCHTFDHCHSWNTPPVEFISSVLRNQDAAEQFFPGIQLACFSYPISGPRPGTKRRLAKLYQSARGGGQTFNKGVTDLNLLNAFFIERSRNGLDDVKWIIEQNAKNKGWLILATHDVSVTHTPFGCSPNTFANIVSAVSASGAVVLTIRDALQRLKSTTVPSAH